VYIALRYSFIRRKQEAVFNFGTTDVMRFLRQANHFFSIRMPLLSIAKKSNVQPNPWTESKLSPEKGAPCMRTKGGYQRSCDGTTSKQPKAQRIVRYTVRSDSLRRSKTFRKNAFGNSATRRGPPSEQHKSSIVRLGLESPMSFSTSAPKQSNLASPRNRLPSPKPPQGYSQALQDILEKV
jgi:hypothetical protein